MDKRLYVAWNHCSRHRFHCPERDKWLDRFLYLVLEQQEFRVPQFFRGMSSVLVEKFVHDFNAVSNSTSSDDVYSNQLDYCLHKRGWLLLNALLSSNLKNLVGVPGLTQTLMHLYGLGVERSIDQSSQSSPKPHSPALLVVLDSPSWPMSDLSSIVSRSDLKQTKSPHRVRRQPSPSSEEECCSTSDTDTEQVELPCLAIDSFRHLILSLLEKIVGHHGNIHLLQSQHLDVAITQFAQQYLTAETKLPEQKRLLRLVIRAMVSTVQNGRPLSSNDIIGHLVDVALGSHHDFGAEVMEVLVRFLATVQPPDDNINKWLGKFHTKKCLQLLIETSKHHHNLTWCNQIATIITKSSGNQIPCHHFQFYGEPLTNVDDLDENSCSISSLFYFLLQIYCIGDVQSQRIVLKTMNSGARPCCCLPPETIHKMLFSRVIESEDFLDVLSLTFRSTGFSFPHSSIEYNCHFCRENGGYDLERCRRAGVYASTESLINHNRTIFPPDRWKSFDFYCEFITERLDCPFSLKMIKKLQSLLKEATRQVKCEIFSRVLYPIISSGTLLERNSTSGRILEECWTTVADLIRQPTICDLFTNSNGLELLLNRSIDQWNVAKVLQSMIIVQLEAKEDSSALTLFENLLFHYSFYIVRCLQQRIPSFNIPELELVVKQVTIDSLEHLESEAIDLKALKTAASLWNSTVELIVTNQSFGDWFKRHRLSSWNTAILPALCDFLNGERDHFNVFVELFEILFAASILTGRRIDVLEHFAPGQCLGVVHEILLKCSTLEKWIDNSRKILFPDLFSLLIRNFADWNEKINEELKPMYYREMNGSITKMDAIIQHPENAALLASKGFLTDWLINLKPVVIRTEPLSCSLRKKMMNVVLNIGRFRITASELQLFIDVLKDERGIDSDALQVLLELLKLNGAGPSHFVTFPVKRDFTGLLDVSGVDDVRSDFVAQARLALELGRFHDGKQIQSAWKTAGIFIGIPSDPAWNLHNDGASLSVWLNLPQKLPSKTSDINVNNDQRDPDWRPDLQDYTTSYPFNPMVDETVAGDVHLFSIGSKNLLVEFWIDPGAENTLLVRLTHANQNANQVLVSQVLDLKLPPGRWNHMAVNWRHRVSALNRFVKLRITTNACQSIDVDLKIPPSQTRRLGNVNSYVLLGTSYSRTELPNRPKWHLAHVTLYKTDTLTNESTVLLSALGPDAGVFLTTCQDGGPKPNFALVVQPKLLDRIADWSRVFDYDKLIEVLQANLLLTFSAHKADSVFVYPSIVSPTAGIFSSLMPGNCGFSAISSDPRTSQQPPIAVPSVTTGPLAAQRRLDFGSAIRSLGGYPVLLFLFGHSIDKAPEECQPIALEILFQWLRFDSSESCSFREKKCYWMLQHAFNSKRARPGTKYASVLLDVACSSSPISKESTAVVSNPGLLAFVLRSLKNSVESLDLILETVQNLIRDDHPHRQFNVYQMERTRVLELLLLIAKESALLKECTPLTEKQSAIIADVIEGLLGSPPDLSHISSIINFLLLTHPLEETHISNEPFYQLSSSSSTSSKFDYDKRQWHLPRGYEAKAPHDLIASSPNQFESALKDVVFKWAESNGVIHNEHVTLNLHLIRILINCIRVMPDNRVKHLFEIIKLDMLIVLLRSDQHKIRAAIVKLINVLLERSEEEQLNFIKHNGVIMLANQLINYPSTPCLIESCLSLCTGVDVILEQINDFSDIWPDNPSPLQLQSIILLLGQLPNSSLDPALFHQIAILIKSLLTKSNHAFRILIDFGLIEVIGKSIVALSHISTKLGNHVLEQREHEVVIEAIHRIVLLVTNRLLSASGNAAWSVFQDTIQTIHLMERVELNECGENSRCVRNLHEINCIILKQSIQTLQHLIEFSRNGRRRSSLGVGFETGEKPINLVVPGCLNRKLRLDKQVQSSEVVERFRLLIVKSVDHAFLNSTRSPIQINYNHDLLVMLVKAMSLNLERPKSTGWINSNGDDSVDWSHYQPPDPAECLRSLYWNSRQVLRNQLNRLLLHLCSPLQDHSMIHFVVKTLHDDPHHEELLKLIPSNDFASTMDSYLFHYLHTRPADVEHGILIKIHCISRILIPATSSQRRNRQFRLVDPQQISDQLTSERINWFKAQEDAQLKLIHRFESLTRQTIEISSNWTTSIVNNQHEINKTFLNQLKSCRMSAVDGWTRLVDQLSHPKSTWHFERSYPKGWQLDETEGHQRGKIRLQTCHLNIDPKYLLPRSKHLVEPEQHSPPLDSLLKENSSFEETCYNENIVKTINCLIVNTVEETSGEMILTDSHLIFKAPERKVDRIKYEDIREIHSRRFLLKETAFELFLIDNRAMFFVFNSNEERDLMMNQLNETCFKLMPPESPADVAQLWRENRITNYEYLVYLNKLAGRSYNDLMQYPVFPFVLADYEAQVLDLNDPRVYRNFKRPMAVQNESRDGHYIENYNYLKRDYENRNLNESNGSGPNFGPFHYGSLYSNPGIVLHFLVRLPPFTKLLMDYQDRNFDVPDRSFHSIATSWRLASSDSTTDVKELIPEFFHLPEFLVNSLGFDFGRQQSGDPVDHVQLPPWSQGDPRLFVLIHRQALESSWVRDHLHHWIDLIFGHKQTGPSAVESINVFHPSTYAGFDVDQYHDPIERSAKLTMIRTYGQVPRQLFKQPHPMNVHLLNPQPSRRTRNLLNSVENLQWGTYAGSPACHDPVVRHSEVFNSPVHSFVPLETGDTYALGPFSAAVIAHSYDKDSFLGRPTGVLGAALVLWGQSDGIVRIKTRKDEPCKPLLQAKVYDSVVTCSTAPDYSKLWVGYRSGLIRVFDFVFDALKPHFELSGHPSLLTAHSGHVKNIVLCPGFSLAVSGGSDGCVVLWDLFKLTFLKSFTPGVIGDRALPVSQLAVNRNTADIACAVNVDQQSKLELRTVNGQLIGSTTTEPVTSLCFSSAPEGVSINVLAAGLSNGHIKLWDTWTMTLIRDIGTDSNVPIVSLSYSISGQHLLASKSDGSLLVYENSNNAKKNARPFVNLTLQ